MQLPENTTILRKQYSELQHTYHHIPFYQAHLMSQAIPEQELKPTMQRLIDQFQKQGHAVSEFLADVEDTLCYE